MPVTTSYREYVADQLAPLGEVEIKRMFGGAGLYFDGKMFGLIDDDTVFLRVNDETRPEFVARQMPAFHPVRSDPNKVSENYYQLPVEVLEDSDALVTWARRAIVAAQSKTAALVRRERTRAAKAKPAKKRSPRKQPR
jgi:DNA transformation protein